MNYNIIASENFRKEAKRLAKKFPSLKDELVSLQDTILENPEYGTRLGNNCYKIRLKVKSKGKGKSGGMRVITLIVKVSKQIHLLTIYDKSEQSDISAKELEMLIREV